MSAELSVVGGLGIISSLFAYYAFSLRESEEMMSQKLAVFLFFMSLVFLNLIMFTIYRLSQETAALQFLTEGILETGLLIMVWTTVGITFILLFSLIIMAITFLYSYYRKIRGKVHED